MRKVIPKPKLEPYEEFLEICFDENHEARNNRDIIKQHIHDFDININDYDLLLDIARDSDYLTFMYFLLKLDADFLINDKAILDVLLINGSYARFSLIMQHNNVPMDAYFEKIKQNSFIMKCLSKMTKQHFSKYFEKDI